MSAGTSSQAMNIVPLLALAGSIIVAIGGWVFTYFHKRRTDARAAKLERANQQLRCLYGPLYARLRASSAVWNAFVENYWPAHGQRGYFTRGVKTTDEEKARWRIWMEEVFEPFHAGIEKLIIDHMDLFEDEEFPQAFVDALAHIAAYKAVFRQWKDGDYSEHTSVCNYPAVDLMNVVEPTYLKLRNEQKKLIQGVQQ